MNPSPPPRRPILALAAGLVMPGLGHVYGGDVVRGAWFLLAVALVVPGAARLALHMPARWLCFTLFVGVTTAVTLYIWSAVDALRRARRSHMGALRPWQRPAVYALYAVVSSVFVLAPLTAAVRDDVVETFVVPSSSMAPNVLPGDRIVADKSVGHPGGARLWRGALAIFINPNDRALIFIKRVVALPGDLLEIDGAEVRVNGQALATSPSGDAPVDAATSLAHERGDHGTYAVLRAAGGPAATGSVSPPLKLVVPDGQVFVLGDNRAVAVDSRRFGTIPLADVKGVARQVWFSADHSDGVRWRRIGRLLD